jgi:hypothetical protein
MLFSLTAPSIVLYDNSLEYSLQLKWHSVLPKHSNYFLTLFVITTVNFALIESVGCDSQIKVH